MSNMRVGHVFVEHRVKHVCLIMWSMYMSIMHVGHVYVDHALELV